MDYDSTNLGKKLLCIEFPGVVKDKDKALETLGGIDAISTAVCSDSKLHLKLRPRDSFCKPAFSVNCKVSAIVLKIKVNKKDKSVKSCSVLGHLDSEHQFQSMMDFQYLPVSDNKFIYRDIVPHDMNLDFFKKDVKLWTQPFLFTRTPCLQTYIYEDDDKEKVNVDPSFKNLIGTKKSNKESLAWYVPYDIEVIPYVPKENKYKNVVNKENLECVKKLFEERPVWPKTGLINISKLKSAHLSKILPLVAYYFSSGPWRASWVRLGFDPRKEPSAVVYQTLDFRVKNIHKGVKGRRRHFHSGIKSNSRVIEIINSSEVVEKPPKVENHIYVPGMVPSTKQFFVQYCDIHVPEVQNLLKNLPKTLSNDLVLSEFGWLNSGQVAEIRKILAQYVQESIKLQNEQESASTSHGKVNDSDSDSEYTGELDIDESD